MREILFRGKRTDGKGWIYGSYIQSNSSWKGGHPHRAWIAEDAMSNGGWFALQKRLPVVDETVGQYTGLKDRNGQRIFEGDIVSADRGYGRFVVRFGKAGGVYTCRCESGYMAFYFEDVYKERNDTLRCDPCYWLDRYEDTRVIGNIFDNPELLKIWRP